MRRGIFLTSALLGALACGMPTATEVMPIKMTPMATAASSCVLAKPRRRETRGGIHRNKRRARPGPRKFKKQMRYSSPGWNVEKRFGSWMKQLYREARKWGFQPPFDEEEFREPFEAGDTPKQAWMEDLSRAA